MPESIPFSVAFTVMQFDAFGEGEMMTYIKCLIGEWTLKLRRLQEITNVLHDVIHSSIFTDDWALNEATGADKLT